MDKKLIGLLLSIYSYSLVAQDYDTVSTGNQYSNQIWYQLATGKTHTSKTNNWDISFQTTSQGSSIHINSAVGVELWQHTSDTSNWLSIDTTGLSKWNKLHNSSTQWDEGAFNSNANPNNPFDLGWGKYNMITHIVKGDKLFIIKTKDNQYKKLWITDLNNGTYFFKYSNLNNSNAISKSIKKTDYNTKNFIYFDLSTNQIIDREPVSSDWDITFTRYTDFIPSPYLVTGVILNDNVEAIEANHIGNVDTYNNWQAYNFSETINTIGYDWKSFNMNTFKFDVADSLVYFIKDQEQNIWKLIFKGFGGSSNGNYIFKKEALGNVSVSEINEIPNKMILFPNPTSTGQTNLEFNSNLNTVSNLIISNLNGQIVKSKTIDIVSGENNVIINTSELQRGIYFIQLSIQNKLLTQKLIVK